MQLQNEQTKNDHRLAKNLNEINTLTPTVGLQSLGFFYIASPCDRGGTAEAVQGLAERKGHGQGEM